MLLASIREGCLLLGPARAAAQPDGPYDAGSLVQRGGLYRVCRWEAVCVFALLLTSCASASRTKEEPAPRRTWSGTAAAPAEAALPAPGPPPKAVDPVLKARVYEALAAMSQAQAEGDTTRMEAALDAAMGDLRLLVQQPDLLEGAEVQALYRSVVTAYEQYYGVSDTLTLEHGDIFAFREAMFASMNQVEEPLLEDVQLPEVRPVRTTISLEENQLVEQSIRFLLRTPDEHLYLWLSRAATYFPMIERILEEEGVPDELKYLAMIESGLNPRARSRVGAGGMWQFMPATGRGYGLQITHWVDERWDPEKSTRAAARHLRDLEAQFGDWHLALAAYNCGPTRVLRAVRQHKARTGQRATFWDIYGSLPRETRNYVPMFIATTLVASRPEAFDLQPVQPGPRYAYEVAPIEGALDLRLAAELAGTDVDMIRALNPEIRQWATPPTRGTYNLRLPPGHVRRFNEAYAALPPEQRRSQEEHVVRRGDTLGKIARRYGITVASLQEANGLRGTLIRVGQRLSVPVRYDASRGAPAPTVARASSGPPVRTASVREPAEAPPAPARSTRVQYRVRRGDHLTGIAARYGVSVAQLKAWNDLRSDRIRTGQTLTLYPGDAGAAAPRSSSRTYVVRRGDNLTSIARKHGVSVSDLQRWNALRSDRIRPGQRLAVRSGGGGAAGGAGEWVAYHVKRGDTLAAIARKYDASVTDLRRWNALRGDRIRVGQRLAIYRP